MEGENPTRRYRWFRPRQAVRGYGESTTQLHYTTMSLYNDSTAAELLVVRHYTVQGVQDSQFQIGVVQGALGSPAGGQTGAPGPFVGNYLNQTGKRAGVINFLDDPLARDGDFFTVVDGPNLFTSRWDHDFPFAVLLPHESLFFQNATPGNEIQLALVWESIFPDELDFAYEL